MSRSQRPAWRLKRVSLREPRSDLVVGQAGKGPVVIEIVVTHDLEPEALEAYRESGIPVLKVRPSWDTLFQLESEVITADTVNVPLVRCSECKNVEQRHRHEQDRTRQRADSMLRRMNERRPTDTGSLPFRPWTHDKFGLMGVAEGAGPVIPPDGNGSFFPVVYWTLVTLGSFSCCGDVSLIQFDCSVGALVELLSNLVEIPFQANCRSVRRSRHPVDLATL